MFCIHAHFFVITMITSLKRNYEFLVMQHTCRYIIEMILIIFKVIKALLMLSIEKC